MDKNKTPRIFEGFWLASAKIITFLCISFTLIIQNVTFLPTIQNPKVTFVFALATAWIGIAVTYFSLRFSFVELDKLKQLEDLRTKK